MEKFHKNNDIKDDARFIDYNLLKSSKSIDGEEARKVIASYLKYNIDLYNDGERRAVVINFSKFVEHSYFPSIGYSQSYKGGRGVKATSFLDILDLVALRDNAEDIMKGNIFAPVLIENYGEDRNSDFLLMLMLPQISDYTLKVADNHGLQKKEIMSEKWDISTNKWIPYKITLARFPGDIVFRLIVPNDILTTGLPYNAHDFVYRYCLEIFNTKRTNNGQKRYTQKRFKEYIKKNYHTNQEYIKDIIAIMDDAQLSGYMTNMVANSELNRDKK